MRNEKITPQSVKGLIHYLSASLGVNQMRAIKQSSDLAFAKSLPIYAVRLCVYASGSSLFN